MSEFCEVNQVDPYHTSHDSDADSNYSQSSSDSENAVNLQNDNNEGQPLEYGKKALAKSRRMEFYAMKCHNIQDAFLNSLISANEVKRR
ncbi:hypothetical protein QE152_g26126 [Popillia japonica]|uniref:Uncharacterized protein n=1 Tax=Popillia japonica TaxID=7064 RepID=A0AAW1JY34_POPJA